MTNEADVFVSSIGTQFIHTYRALDMDNPEKLKRDTRIGDLTVGIEIFGSDGRSIAMQVDRSFTVRSLHFTNDGPEPAKIAGRLDEWAQSLRDKINDESSQELLLNAARSGELPNLGIEDLRRIALDAIPQFGDLPLEERFDILDTSLFPDGDPGSGSPLHNLTHIFG